MAFPVFVPFVSESRYSLLGAMSREIAEAFAAKGCPVNPEGVKPGTPGAPASVVLWLNFLGSTGLKAELTRPGARVALVQFFVDHPLALAAEQMDVLSRLENFRMCLPCVDGTHLLRMRWPRLRHVHCLHGVAASALVPRESIGAGREDDVVVMGSIHSEAELAALKAGVSTRFHAGCDEAVELMVANAWMGFEQAVEVALTPLGVLVGEWALMTSVWKYVTAAVNRRRRVSIVRALEGVKTAVYGGEAWKEFCRGGAGAAAAGRSTIEFRGDVAYEGVAATMRRARVCVAWGPTQFVHSFSERLLLGLASGCGVVADDRMLVRKHFGAGIGDRRLGIGEEVCLRVFDGGRPEMARAAVEGLLGDPEKCAAMGLAGRDAVERGHLWAHRVETIAAVASGAIGG